MQPTTSVECIACGDETAVTKRSKAIYGDCSRGFLCENCFGIYHLPDDTPECDVHDCDELAPFAIFRKVAWNPPEHVDLDEVFLCIPNHKCMGVIHRDTSDD
jgi:hypothetical protein